MVIDPSGRVGIGTINPIVALDISGNLSVDDISANTVYAKDISATDIIANDVSGVHFYTLDGNVDINGTKSIFTDISANDASFNRVDISGITNLGVFYSQPSGEEGDIMYNKTTKQFDIELVEFLRLCG